MKKQKALQAVADQYNAIIHNRNMALPTQSGGRRVVNAHVVDGVILVDDLYESGTNYDVSKYQFQDGYGYPVNYAAVVSKAGQTKILPVA